MKHLGKACIAAGLAVFVTAACFDDPTSDLRNGGSRLSLSKTFVILNAGQVDQIDIRVLDDQGNPQEFGEPTFTSVDATVATLTPLADSTLRRNPGNTVYKSTLSGLAAGQTNIEVSAGGVLDTIAVIVYPVAFTGAVTPASGNMGDTITIAVPANVTFDTATAGVTLNGGPVLLVSKSSTALRIQAPNVTNGTLTVTGSVLLGTISLPALPVSTTITVANQSGEPANDNMLAPAALTPTTSFQTLYGSLTSGTDGNDFYRIVLAAPGIIEAFLDFTGSGAGNAGNPDIDVYVTKDVNGNGVVNAADICDEFGGTFVEADCTGATAANPEHEITQVLPAGTYYINVELFLDGSISQPLPYKLRYRIQ